MPPSSTKFIARPAIELTPGSNVRALAFSPSGVLFVCSDGKGRISVYDSLSGAMLTSFTVATGALSPSSNASNSPGITSFTWTSAFKPKGMLRKLRGFEIELARLVAGTLEGFVHRVGVSLPFAS